MIQLKRLFAWLAVVGLAACGGGGGDPGTPVLGGNSGPKATELVLILSSNSVANTGLDSIVATVVALDANRNVMANVPVAFSADNGAVVTPSGTVTGSDGRLTATVGIGADRSNRTIVVSAKSGSLTNSTTLQVVTETSPTTPEAADLSLALSAASITNGGTSTIVATATAVDRNRNVLAGIPVTFSVDSSAVAQVSGNVTNADGVVTANVGIGADRSNRVITVTATSGTLTRTASFTVTGAKLQASAAPLVIAGSSGNTIEYTLTDFNAIAMTGQSISVSAPGLPTFSGQTDLNGKFRYTYDAPAVASTLQISATAAGDTRVETVTVQLPGAGESVPPAEQAPLSASISPTPSVVAVNAVGSSTNQVEVRALFLGANNKPIPRIRVRFDLAGNTSTTDGKVTWVGAYAYSDANGVARATFTPGQRSSPTNGVTIRACYDVSDFTSSNVDQRGCESVPASVKTVATTLTVSSEALAVSIRTNELIKSGAAELTYIKEFVVMVVDSAGQAKPDVQITPSVDLPAYYKGFWAWSPVAGQWVQSMVLAANESYRWDAESRSWGLSGATSQPQCPNEDVNRNGVREASAFDGTVAAPALGSREEDLNWNGDLDPRKSDVAVKMVGSTKTDANGLAIVQIEYGRDLASWVDFVITVTASGIAGTEARARYSGHFYGLGSLPFPATAIAREDSAPPFVISPYGLASVCTNPN